MVFAHRRMRVTSKAATEDTAFDAPVLHLRPAIPSNRHPVGRIGFPEKWRFTATVTMWVDGQRRWSTHVAMHEV